MLAAAMTRQLDELMKVLVTELRSNPATALDASPLTHTPRFASLASHHELQGCPIRMSHRPTTAAESGSTSPVRSSYVDAGD